MPEFPGIQYQNILRKSMDYFFLRKEGIRYAQELSGELWTDYNDHDPGVTILEQLCYALSIVGYKTNLDVRDLLFSGDPNGETMRLNGIFAPEEIFLTGTVTHTDFKILLLNKLRKEKVEDIWFRKSTDRSINGLYDIYVRTSLPMSAYAKLEQRVREVYVEHRSLCEDLHRVVILKPEYIEIITAIEIRENVLPEPLLAEIFFKLNTYFNPKPSNHSFHELVEAGLSYEDIFDLPSFESGFIRDHQSADYTTQFSISGITAIIEQIPGIRKVRNLIVKKDGIRVTNPYIHIEDGHVAKIVVNPAKKDIEIYRNYSIVNYDPGLVKRYYDEKSEQGNKSHSFIPSSFEKATQDVRSQISFYTSVQNTFPIVYGIGKFGLPGDADKNRIRKARQLQSFLLFFDQILINHLAQLANLPTLFSYKVQSGESMYFARLPVEGDSEVPDFEKLTTPQFNDRTVSELVNDASVHRKNQLLDHLLARFSETLFDHPYTNLATVLGLTQKEDLPHALASIKSALLDKYQLLSRDRNKGYTYSMDSVIEYPFKTKLCLLLKIDIDAEYWVSLTTLYGSLLPTESKPRALNEESTKRKVRFTLPNHPDVRDYLVFYGSIPDSYQIIQVKDKEESYALLFHTPLGKTMLAEYGSQAEAEAEKQELANKFQTLNKKAERFHVVEHILLRPLLYKQYDIELVLPAKRWLFKSTFSDDLEEQEYMLTEAIILGTQRSSYAIAENEQGFTVTLTDKSGNPLLRLEKVFETYERASESITDWMVPQFESWDRDRPAIPAEATFRQSGELSQQEEVQTPKITLVFPKWVPRFSDPDFKVLLQHSLAKCLPAHLEVQLLWLGLGRMAEFEKKYKQWMSQKAKVTQQWQSILSRKNTTEPASTRKEKRVLRDDIAQLDTLSDELFNGFIRTENK